jgi:calcium/calmodulin-dependent 3',5'-cyclic nucleotide phosphodiesterase
MLEAMLNHVEAGYTANGNPYHNNMHACDVLQTTHYFISQTGLAVSPSIKFIPNKK